MYQAYWKEGSFFRISTHHPPSPTHTHDHTFFIHVFPVSTSFVSFFPSFGHCDWSLLCCLHPPSMLIEPLLNSAALLQALLDNYSIYTHVYVCARWKNLSIIQKTKSTSTCNSNISLVPSFSALKKNCKWPRDEATKILAWH